MASYDGVPASDRRIQQKFVWSLKLIPLQICFPFAIRDTPLSVGTVRLARFKFDSPSGANTHTVETTMPPGLHGNLTHF